MAPENKSGGLNEDDVISILKKSLEDNFTFTFDEFAKEKAKVNRDLSKELLKTIRNTSDKSSRLMLRSLRSQINSLKSMLSSVNDASSSNLQKFAKDAQTKTEAVMSNFYKTGTSDFDSKLKGMLESEQKKLEIFKARKDTSAEESDIAAGLIKKYDLLLNTQKTNMKWNKAISDQMKLLKPAIDTAFGPLLKIESILNKSGIGRSISSIFNLSGVRENFEKNIIGSLRSGKLEMSSFSGAVSKLSAGLGESFAAAGKFMLSPLGIILLITAAMIALWNVTKKYQKDWRAIMDATGLLKDEGEYLVRQSYDIAKNYGAMGVNAELASKAGIALVNEFGSLRFADTTEQSEEFQANIALAAANLGLAVEDGATLTKLMQSMGVSSPKIQKNLMLAAAALSKAAGVPAGKVLSDMAKSSAVINTYFRGNFTNVVKTAVELHKMGMELKDIETMSTNLLDWEGNIGASMEASVLLGRQIDMNRARLLMMQGDMEGMTNEVLKQVGSLEQFNKMNLIQKQALAKATGLSADQLTKSLTQQARYNKLTTDQRKEYDAIKGKIDAIKEGKDESVVLDMRQQLASERLAASVEQLKQSLTNIAVRIAPLILGIIKVIAYVVEGIAMLFGGASGDLSNTSDYAEQLSGNVKDISKGVEKASGFVGTLKAGFSNILQMAIGLGVAMTIVKKLLSSIGNKIFGSGSLTEKLSSTKKIEEDVLKSEGLATRITGVFKTIQSVVKSIGKSIVTIFKSLGQAIGQFLKGVATGMRAFADPMVILGTVIVTGALIGIGYAAKLAAPAIVALGDAFAKIVGAIGVAIVGIITSVASALVTISSINAANLIAVAVGIGAVGIALAQLGTGKIIDGIGNLFGGEGSMNRMIDKLIEFSAAANDVNILANAIKKLTYEMNGLSSVDTSKLNNVMNSAASLRNLQSGGRVSVTNAGSSTSLSGVSSDDRVVKLLERIAYSLENSKNDVYMDSKKVGEMVRSNERRPAIGGHV
jgi:hypothetical protein